MDNSDVSAPCAYRARAPIASGFFSYPQRPTVEIRLLGFLALEGADEMMRCFRLSDDQRMNERCRLPG